MSFTLDDLRTAITNKYGPFEVETPEGVVSLRNAITLSKAERTKLRAAASAVSDLQGEGEDTDVDEDVREDLLAASLLDMIAIVGAGSPAAALRSLQRAVKGDLAALTTLWETYSEASDTGNH